MALLGDHRTDAEQRFAGLGSTRRPGDRGAGLGDTHPDDGQVVELDQAVPGPGARRHGRGRGFEDHALSPPRVVVGWAVAERHVDEHDEAEATRLRYQHLGRGRGDQPVEQHDGVIGDLSQGLLEGRERCRAGTIPETGDGALVRRPAMRAELTQEVAVVGVPAARPERIVDAVGHDEEHLPHSGRS